MSKLPGPTQHDPFSTRLPSRTPGSLGIFDAADPTAYAEIGDTPGALGYNDHAAAMIEAHSARAVTSPIARRARVILRERSSGGWDRFLDSLCDWSNVSGPRLAWESPAHSEITLGVSATDAQDLFMQEILPPEHVRRRLLSVLKSLSIAVVEADITIEQYSDTKAGKKLGLSQTGQASHFMANKGQSQRDAYVYGLAKVFNNTNQAIILFKQMKNDADFGGATRALAEGIHALQDSFSPAHVVRTKQGNKYVISQILVWSEQQKAQHEAGDQSWKLPDGKLSPLGQECYVATTVLLAYFVLSVLNKDDEAQKQRLILLDRYFSTAFRVE